MTRHTLASLLSILFLLTACDPIDARDAGAQPDANVPPALEVGTGAVEFAAIGDGDTLLLERGPQGAQHVWVALRAWGIDPRRTLLTLSLVRDRDGATVSQLFHVRVSLTAVPGETYAEVTGLTLVVPDPEQALNEELTLAATVTAHEDSGGEVLASERPIRIEWAPGQP